MGSLTPRCFKIFSAVNKSRFSSSGGKGKWMVPLNMVKKDLRGPGWSMNINSYRVSIKLTIGRTLLLLHADRSTKKQ